MRLYSVCIPLIITRGDFLEAERYDTTDKDGSASALKKRYVQEASK
jgi:hypothetical protein